MSDGKRPGGLTALAVLNFVFGGLGALGLLVLFAAIGALKTAADASGSDVTTELANAPGAGMLWLSLILATATVALLITSGVGYLGMKRFLGRTLGNVYALVSIASSVVGVMTHEFGIGTIIGLVYPVLTLVLINTTFKDDLVR